MSKKYAIATIITMIIGSVYILSTTEYFKPAPLALSLISPEEVANKISTTSQNNSEIKKTIVLEKQNREETDTTISNTKPQTLAIISTSSGMYSYSYVYKNEHVNLTFILPDEFIVDTHRSSSDTARAQLFIGHKDTQKIYYLRIMIERSEEYGMKNCHYEYCILEVQDTFSTKNNSWKYLGYETPGGTDIAPTNELKKEHIFTTYDNSYNLYLSSPNDLRINSDPNFQRLFDSMILSVN